MRKFIKNLSSLVGNKEKRFYVIKGFLHKKKYFLICYSLFYRFSKSFLFIEPCKSTFSASIYIHFNSQNYRDEFESLAYIFREREREREREISKHDGFLFRKKKEEERNKVLCRVLFKFKTD